MFAFKLWGNFGVFRDPITISQNITLGIPPKTTVGGMLASVLGIDYNDYFKDTDYFSFEYSVVLNNPIRKKSFSQNYVEDYTKKSEIKYSCLDNYSNSKEKLSLLIEEREGLTKQMELSKKDSKQLAGLAKKIQNAESDLEKNLITVDENISKKMTKPKPIRRELLINPNYIIFINNFKYEDEVILAMKKHQSAFLFYMGNTEYPANYQYLDCIESINCSLKNVDSFTKSLDKINFEPGNKYSTIHFATSVVGNREYRDYKRLVFCDFGKKISFRDSINGFSIKLADGDYNCEFV
ncbi:MAG: CRISPR-associated protein Cas5 [Candidatus Delongbacteria bacterium]|jgi:CRISPR-associated protein Cas5h|nr:CRISPR-associated protein Cas5 [Candidatus Delongbacteria bacterium]